MPLQIIEVYGYGYRMLHSIIITQGQIRDSMAMQWKNHIIWNPTIPQDKKFSTVTKLPGPCSSQSQRCTHYLIGLEDHANVQRILQQKI